MKVLVTGASGFVGTRLVRRLLSNNDCAINILSRSLTTYPADRLANPLQDSQKITCFHWNPLLGEIDQDAFTGVSAIVHLAGESILGLRWTSAKKQRILDSRVKSTKLLVDTVNVLPEAAIQKFISASAIGFYGDRKDEKLTEDSPRGQGFLSDVCQSWENALLQSSLGSIKKYILRFGLVLGAEGGALKLMLPAFRLGLGGVLGSGNQYMSWIHVDDICEQIVWLLNDNRPEGIYNSVAPQPLTNRDFTTTFNNVLQKRNFLPVPSFALRAGLGEMSVLLLTSQRVIPKRFLQEGYSFTYSDLKEALGKEIHSKEQQEAE